MKLFSPATFCMLRVYDAYLGKCCVDRGSSVPHEFYVNEGVWTCRNAPPKYVYGINVKGKNFKWQIYVPVGILYCIQWKKTYFIRRNGPTQLRKLRLARLKEHIEAENIPLPEHGSGRRVGGIIKKDYITAIKMFYEPAEELNFDEPPIDGVSYLRQWNMIVLLGHSKEKDVYVQCCRSWDQNCDVSAVFRSRFSRLGLGLGSNCRMPRVFGVTPKITWLHGVCGTQSVGRSVWTDVIIHGAV